jgi:dienelactone hydrolase
MTMVTTSELSFTSSGQRCAAWLYLPADVSGPVPCVVMAHGLTGTVDFGLDRYAQRFATAGLAVLLFDYRQFGASDGRPRQEVNVRRQVADLRAAVRFARSLPQVDADRVALWGTSLGAGHVVTVAGTDPRIAAVVAQVPFLGIDARASTARPRRVTRRLFVAAVRDVVGAFLGRQPVLVPVVAEPGSVAVFTGARDYAAVSALAAAAPRWRNELAARSLWSLIAYRPARQARRIAMPLLMCVVDGDTAASVPLAIRTALHVPHRHVRRYPGDHFAAYQGQVFERMVTDEIEFLRRQLAPVAAAG